MMVISFRPLIVNTTAPKNPDIPGKALPFTNAKGLRRADIPVTAAPTMNAKASESFLPLPDIAVLATIPILLDDLAPEMPLILTILSQSPIAVHPRDQ
jgi:hypothetical protein